MSTKKVKIAIFPPKSTKETVLGSNGIVLDSICLEYGTTEELSSTGDYTLDATFLLDENGLYKHIVDEAIIKALVDGEEEIFRIVKNTPSTRNITIVTKQITITEQKQLWLDDVRPTQTGGQGAISHMYNNAVGVKEIIITSDIPVVSTAYYQLINLYQACYDCDQSFTNRWGVNGLETTRRKYNLFLNTKRGTQSNLSIIEGKNLTGFEARTNIDSFVTRGIGKGFNGVKGHYVESSNISKYARVNTKVFDYPDIKVKTADYQEGDEGTWFDTEAEAIVELDRRVGLEFTENHVDEIKATYNINFVNLEKTEEYKNYSHLEKANIGDLVKVYVKSLDIDITVRVVKKKCDGLTQRVDEIRLSNTSISATISTSKIIEDLKKQYQNSGNPNINDYINAIIEAGMKDSNVIVRNGEFLIMDTKDINTARNVWRWNSGALVHSNEGYYSKNWNVGITQDGMINASRILTGILTTVLIQNLDGSFEIDLSGTGGALFRNNGKDAIKIVNNAIQLYNWAENGDFIGSLGSLVNTAMGIPYISLWNDVDSLTSIGYAIPDSNTIGSYVEFDKYGVKNPFPITFKEMIEFMKEVQFRNNVKCGGIQSILGERARINFLTGGNEGVAINVDLVVEGQIRAGSVAAGTKIYSLDGSKVIYPINEGGNSNVVEQARRLIGLPYSQDYFNYLTNEIPPYCDCSSLCQWSYYQIGKTISRTTYTQINEGVEIAQGEVKPGDMVFSNFSSPGVPEHVYMYSKFENGQHWCVEASTYGKPCKERTFNFTGDMRVRRM